MREKVDKESRMRKLREKLEWSKWSKSRYAEKNDKKNEWESGVQNGEKVEQESRGWTK